MRLVFVEGVSGVGKSTLAKKLCECLIKMGHMAKAYLEFDFDNPIDFYCTAYFMREDYEHLLDEYAQQNEAIKANTIIADNVRLVRYYNRETPLFTEPLLSELSEREFCFKPKSAIPLAEFTRVYKKVWENFAHKSGQYDYLIFDGSLLHHPINDIMRNYNATPKQINNHVYALTQAITAHRPLVVYLSSDNVAERLAKACISRNQPPRTPEQMTFWEKRKRNDLTVLPRLGIPFEMFDISRENWDALYDEIITFVTERTKACTK
jgi:hypothetical protein